MSSFTNFGNPNKKAEKLIKKMQKQGMSPTNYQKRKSCYNCKYFSSIGNCNFHNKMTIPQELCSHYWGK